MTIQFPKKWKFIPTNTTFRNYTSYEIDKHAIGKKILYKFFNVYQSYDGTIRDFSYNEFIRGYEFNYKEFECNIRCYHKDKTGKSEIKWSLARYLPKMDIFGRHEVIKSGDCQSDSLAAYLAVDELSRYFEKNDNQQPPICLYRWLEELLAMEALSSIGESR